MSLVPYPRERHRGAVGRDVSADQRALTVAGVRPWIKVKGKRTAFATGHFDATTEQQVKAFQRKHGLDADGVIGPMTHAALSKPRPTSRWGFYSQYGAKVMGIVKARIDAHSLGLMRERDVVRKCVNAALLTVRYRDSIHYTQGSLRMVGVNQRIFPPNFPHFGDCSSMYTWWKFVAGAPDPNRSDYNGEGYTGTQEDHGEFVARPAVSAPLTTAVFYGYGSAASHVAMAVGNGMVVSHGSEVGPVLIYTGYRSDIRHGRLHSNTPRPGFRAR